MRVAPVVSGARVSPLICMLSRPFGAGLGIGTTCCAVDDVAGTIRPAAMTSAHIDATREGVTKPVIRDF
jgi:hypothetical protein